MKVDLISSVSRAALFIPICPVSVPLLFLYQPKGPGQTVSCLIENDIDRPILAGILNLEFGAAEAHWRFVPRFVNSSAMSQSFAPRPPCHMQRPVGFALDGGGCC